MAEIFYDLALEHFSGLRSFNLFFFSGAWTQLDYILMETNGFSDFPASVVIGSSPVAFLWPEQRKGRVFMITFILKFF